MNPSPNSAHAVYIYETNKTVSVYRIQFPIGSLKVTRNELVALKLRGYKLIYKSYPSRRLVNWDDGKEDADTSW